MSNLFTFLGAYFQLPDGTVSIAFLSNTAGDNVRIACFKGVQLVSKVVVMTLYPANKMTSPGRPLFAG